MTSFGLARRLPVALGLLALLAMPARAQQKNLTLDDLYDPARRINFGSFPGSYTWLNDKEFVKLGSGRGGPAMPPAALTRVNAETGAETPLFDPARLEAALAKLPGIAASDATKLSRQRPVFTKDFAALAVTVGDDLYYWSVGADAVMRLSSAPGAEEEAQFSPDGRLRRLRARQRSVRLRSRRPRARAHDRRRAADPERQARLGLRRGDLRPRQPSRVLVEPRLLAPRVPADSTSILCPGYAVVDHVPFSQVVEDTTYPRAGDPNPTVKLGVVSAAGSAPDWVDLSTYSGAEPLIVDVSWSPDSKQVFYQVQNREQTWLDLNTARLPAATSRTLFRETTKAWVNNTGAPVWLKDGSSSGSASARASSTSTTTAATARCSGQVTNGEWEVRTLYGVDEAGGFVYFAGTERSAIGGDIYRIKLDGRA